MDLSNDPEIICVFCGLGFTSVENVELHIHQNHQSSNIDQIENKKTCIIDDYTDQTQTEESLFMSKEKKEINVIVLQKDIKSENTSSETSEPIRTKIPNNLISKHYKKSSKLINKTQKSSDHFSETGINLENNNLNDHGASVIPHISETIANLVDVKMEKVMKRSLRCQNCDKQFTLSNNLSRHRRLYCSSLKENNLQNNCCQNGIIESHKATSSSNMKCLLINKPIDISKEPFQTDSFVVKKDSTKSKSGKLIQKHKCRKCFKRFLFKITQIIHLQNHDIEDHRKWKCENCGYRYSKKEILLHHYERGCVITFPSHSQTDSYIETHPESSTCQYCKTIFTKSIYMTMHQLKVCLKFPDKKIHIKIKREKFSTEVIENHEINVDNTYKLTKDEPKLVLSAKSNSVDQCVTSLFDNELRPQSPQWKLNGPKSEPLDNSGNQKFHWHNYADEIQQKSFQCEICKKSFSSRSSLSNHIKSHYSSRGQPFTCRDCNRRFVNLISLQDHRREMCSQKSNESEQKAVYSSLNFNGVSQVPIWPNITNANSGNQPVTCLHCNGVFYDRLELEEHALSKHSNEQGNILCLLCERSFTTNMALRVHLTKSHGFANGGCPGVSQNLPPMPKLETNYHIDDDFPIKKRRKDKRLCELDKEYACDNCHRNFSTGQALGNHKRACLNMPNEFISVETKPPSQNSKSNSKLHSIESLIFDNTNIRSSFTNDKNVFLAFN